MPSPESKAVKFGIVGVGNMGSAHARSFREGRVRGAELVAVADIDRARLEPFGELRRFADGVELIRSGCVDAVLVATPHYAHTPLSIDALGQGLHVLCEKPLAVHKADAERMLIAYTERPDRAQLFAEMFNQRTDPRYAKLRALVRAGELGELWRIHWTITDWFRAEAYYRSSPWRATWRGEGGGVLSNQCAHNLDLWQWMFGMPASVRAFCGFGRFHAIEVEDQVTAYLEYPNGAAGVFAASTGEAPGTNRLEVAGDRGKVVIEGETFSFVRNETPASEFSKASREAYAAPPVWNVQIPVKGSGTQHVGVIQNFVDSIRNGEPLLAPAVEGIHSVELANAMIYSALEGQTVKLPLDSRAYAAKLERLVQESQR